MKVVTMSKVLKYLNQQSKAKVKDDYSLNQLNSIIISLSYETSTNDSLHVCSYHNV